MPLCYSMPRGFFCFCFFPQRFGWGMLSAQKTDRIYLFIFKFEGLRSSLLQKPTAKEWQNDSVRWSSWEDKQTLKLFWPGKSIQLSTGFMGGKSPLLREILFLPLREADQHQGGRKAFWSDDTFLQLRMNTLQRNRGRTLIFLSIELKPCHSLLCSQLQGITHLGM